MHILIIGGTIFLGRALVEAAQERGHTLTLFNRGQSNPGLFPEVETLTGDRGGDLAALRGRTWDAAIDTCGYFPRLVRHSAEFLSQAVEHYTFVSSLSVYANSSQPNMDENSATGKLADETIEEITGETYGPLKALCEQAAEAAMPGRVLSVRAGLIVGPYDRSDRFTYWPWRIAQGGEVLAPGHPQNGVQFIDVRDLAAWIIRGIEQRLAGAYNVVGPAQPLPMETLLSTCRQVSGSAAHFTWVGESFLLAQGVQPWIEMPLWIPASDPESAGFFAFNIQKALETGLTFCPLEETVSATLEWLQKRPQDHTWRAGLDLARETRLLQDWKQTGGQHS